MIAAVLLLVACAADESAFEETSAPSESVAAASETSAGTIAVTETGLLGTWAVNDAPPAHPQMVFSRSGDQFLLQLVDNGCALLDETTKEPLPAAHIRIDPKLDTGAALPSGIFAAVDFVGIDRAQTLDPSTCGTQSTVLRGLYGALRQRVPVKYSLALNPGAQNQLALTFGDGQMLTAYQDSVAQPTATDTVAVMAPRSVPSLGPPPTTSTIPRTSVAYATTTTAFDPSESAIFNPSAPPPATTSTMFVTVPPPTTIPPSTSL